MPRLREGIPENLLHMHGNHRVPAHRPHLHVAVLPHRTTGVDAPQALHAQVPEEGEQLRRLLLGQIHGEQQQQQPTGAEEPAGEGGGDEPQHPRREEDTHLQDHRPAHAGLRRVPDPVLGLLRNEARERVQRAPPLDPHGQLQPAVPAQLRPQPLPVRLPQYDRRRGHEDPPRAQGLRVQGVLLLHHQHGVRGVREGEPVHRGELRQEVAAQGQVAGRQRRREEELEGQVRGRGHGENLLAGDQHQHVPAGVQWRRYKILNVRNSTCTCGLKISFEIQKIIEYVLKFDRSCPMVCHVFEPSLIRILCPDSPCTWRSTCRTLSGTSSLSGAAFLRTGCSSRTSKLPWRRLCFL